MLTKRTIVFSALAVVVLVAGVATWAFAQGGSGEIHACVKNNGQVRIVASAADCDGNNETHLSWGTGGGGGGGGSTFAWFGSAAVQNDSCFGLQPALGISCDFSGFSSNNILLHSNGVLTALAVRPLENTSTKPVRITVLVNGEESGLFVEVPAGSTAFVVARIPINVPAGALIAFKTHAMYLPGEEVPTIPYPGPYPEPGGFPPAFRYLGSVEYRSQ